MNDLLSKENFWNEIEDKYPDALSHFRMWIDKYKEEVNWEDLFGNTQVSTRDKYEGQIKFHHLPDELQCGILIRYQIEFEKGSTVINQSKLKTFFSEVQKRLIKI